MYSTQKKKEDTVKYRTASVSCKSDFNFKEVLTESLNLNQAVIENHTYKPSFKVIGNPNFYFDDDSAIVEYKIERENWLNDWTNNKTQHTGSVIVKKQNNGEIHVSS